MTAGEVSLRWQGTPGQDLMCFDWSRTHHGIQSSTSTLHGAGQRCVRPFHVSKLPVIVGQRNVVDKTSSSSRRGTDVVRF